MIHPEGRRGRGRGKKWDDNYEPVQSINCLLLFSGINDGVLYLAEICYKTHRYSLSYMCE